MFGNANLMVLTAEMEPRLFNLDFQLLADAVLTMIAVFVLFLAMSYFLFNPARKMLDARKKKIKDELDGAAGDLAKAQSLKSEYEGKLKEIDREAQEILSEARKKALQNENQIVSSAKEEATRILDHAKVEAELEKQKVADDVKKEMISIASVMAGKVVEKSIDKDTQDSLIDETLKEIGESTWLS